MSIAKTVLFGWDRDFSRLISIEILVPNIYLFTFLLQNWLQNGQKVWEIQIFVLKIQKSSKSLDNISIYLDKISITFKYLENLDLSRKSRFVSTISIKISTHLNLDWKVSILKISTEIKKSWSWHEG
jgi:hypothetical protein